MKIIKPKNLKLWLSVFICLIVFLCIYTLIGLLIDQRNYSRAQQAYQNANCSQVLLYSGKITKAWRLFDFGNHKKLIQSEQVECQEYARAEEAYQSGDYADAFLSYYDFMVAYPGSPLVKNVQEQVKLILAKAEFIQRLELKVCDRLNELVAEKTIGSDYDYLAGIYTKCGEIYDERGDHQKANAMYEKLIDDFPGQAMALFSRKDIPAEMQLRLCKQIDPARKELQGKIDAPEILLKCGELFEQNKDYDNAIDIYDLFLKKFTDNARIDEVKERFARLIFNKYVDKGVKVESVPINLLYTPMTGLVHMSTTIEFKSLHSGPSRIILYGPQVIIDETEACQTCKIIFSPTGMISWLRDACHTERIVTSSLKPGEYKIIMEWYTEDNPFVLLYSIEIPDISNGFILLGCYL